MGLTLMLIREGIADLTPVGLSDVPLEPGAPWYLCCYLLFPWSQCSWHWAKNYGPNSGQQKLHSGWRLTNSVQGNSSLEWQGWTKQGRNCYVLTFSQGNCFLCGQPPHTQNTSTYNRTLWRVLSRHTRGDNRPASAKPVGMAWVVPLTEGTKTFCKFKWCKCLQDKINTIFSLSRHGFTTELHAD